MPAIAHAWLCSLAGIAGCVLGVSLPCVGSAPRLRLCGARARSACIWEYLQWFPRFFLSRCALLFVRVASLGIGGCSSLHPFLLVFQGVVTVLRLPPLGSCLKTALGMIVIYLTRLLVIYLVPHGNYLIHHSPCLCILGNY